MPDSESLRPRTDAERPTPVVPDLVLIRRIGEGAYGEVWLARSVVSTYRAVKVVYRNTFKDSRPYEREYRGIQKFEPISRSHDGFVDILQIGRNDEAGHFYYVMELADKENKQGFALSHQSSPGAPLTADTLMTDYTPRNLRGEIQLRGRLPFEECLPLAMSLTLALAHLHRHGLIHRDIKPSNIIFIGGIPKLADIGLVTEVEQARTFVGTEGFIPPEGPNSPQADIYSLGKVLYEMSMGKDRLDFPEPFTALGQAPDSPDLEELNSIIVKACEPNPRDRYRTAEEMHVDLALLQSGKSIKAKRLLTRRLALARTAGGIAAGIAAVASGGGLFQHRQARRVRELLNLSESLAAHAQIHGAEESFERGDSPLALAQLADVVRRHPGQRVAAERILAAMTQRSFPRIITPPIQLDDRAWQVRFSPDELLVATVSGDHLVRLWDVGTGKETIPPLRHASRVELIAFSPDGSKLIVAANDPSVSVWDVRSGKPAFPHLVHSNHASAAAISPNGAWIATGAADSNARLHDATTGQTAYPPLSHHRSEVPDGTDVSAVAFSPDSRWLASGSSDGIVAIWDTTTGRPITKLTLEAGAKFVEFSPNGEWLAAAFKPDIWKVQVWQTAEWKPLNGPLNHQRRIYRMAFSPDGHRLVTATANNAARVWEIATGRELFQLGHAKFVHSARFSHEGSRIVTASADGTARIWDASTGESVLEPLRHAGRVMDASFNRDGNRVVTASWDKSVKVWDVQPRAARFPSLRHGKRVQFAEFDLEGSRVLTATAGGLFTANEENSWRWIDSNSVAIWKTTSGTSERMLQTDQREPLAAQFTKAGARALLADGRESRRARVWDMETGTPIGPPVQHAPPDMHITTGCFNDSGSRLATGTLTGVVRIWDAHSARAITEPLRHRGRINSVRFSPDGRLLVTASADGSALVWDAATGRPVADPLQHSAGVWFAQFSRSGTRVVTTSLDFLVKVWSADGTLLASFSHTLPVEYAEFSPDEKMVVTAPGDHMARLWNVETGRQLVEFRGHGGLVIMARFSPDGRRILTASLDGSARLWDAATGLQIADPFRHKAEVVSANFSPDGRRVITASLDQTAQIWEIPAVPSIIPLWLPEVAEALGGQRLNDQRLPESVPWYDSVRLRGSLEKLNGNDPLLNQARRLLGVTNVIPATSPLPNRPRPSHGPL